MSGAVAASDHANPFELRAHVRRFLAMVWGPPEGSCATCELPIHSGRGRSGALVHIDELFRDHQQTCPGPVAEGWDTGYREKVGRLVAALGEPGTCRSCSRPIWWVKMLKTGKAAPFTDAALNHFADCPFAVKHKGKGIAG